MATTAIFPIRVGSRRGVLKSLKETIDYMLDHNKTNMGEYVSSYSCTPEIADAEFFLAKEQYHLLTNRRQGKKDVIAYHVRQSFAPGEITPEEANRIGHELAMRFTKGRNAFIVCTHTNCNHIHNHVVWNSTNLDCRKKFRNFIGSAFALRRCSDILCAENGLSVIKNPEPSPGRDYAKHMYGKDKHNGEKVSYQNQIRQIIDDAINKAPSSFEDFISLVETAGITAKRRGKNMRFRLPGQKQFTRLSTLKGAYTEEAIRGRIAKHTVLVKSTKPSLLIDIQAKMQLGKGEGYAKWAARENLKQMARTLIYLQENGLDSFERLNEKVETVTENYNKLAAKISELDEKLTSNANLQKQIVTYTKTRNTYAEYRKSGYSKTFKASHEADIILHQAAKKSFDVLGYCREKKLPRVANLRAEYAPMLEEKKKAYREYRQTNADMQELLTAKMNVQRFLNIEELQTKMTTKEATR